MCSKTLYNLLKYHIVGTLINSRMKIYVKMKTTKIRRAMKGT